MGLLSLFCTATLAFMVPFISRGNFITSGPCQPFKSNQSFLCSKFQAMVQGQSKVNKVCNHWHASCHVNITLRKEREDRLWGYCYCDSLCKTLGDCCVDFDEWFIPGQTSDRNPSMFLSCRRLSSNEKNEVRGFVMIASCPFSWNGTETAQACMSTNYSSDLLFALPVVDIMTNVTYANIYCAMCHNKTYDIFFWSLFIVNKQSSLPSLQEFKPDSTIWEARPVGDVKKCIATPAETFRRPETEERHLCNLYANSISIHRPKQPPKLFKNAHCAILEKFNLSDGTLNCGINLHGRFPPTLKSALFVFSTNAKPEAVWKKGNNVFFVNYSCQIGEFYDPFKRRCLPVHYNANLTKTTKHKQCYGPRFRPAEFTVLNNNSVFVFSHKKIYDNDSFILANRSLVLCFNISRLYMFTKPPKTTIHTKNNKKQANNNKPQDEGFALRIITYVGFSLSFISLLFLLLTFFTFVELRTYPSKMVMHLSVAMIAMKSVYFAADPDVVSSTACAVMGSLLHFYILVVFLWMSVIAHNAQQTFSNLILDNRNPLVIAGKRRAYIRYSIFCWVMPVIIVTVCVLLQLTTTGNATYGNEDGCQLSLPARTYAITIPVSASILFNIVALIRTAIALKQGGQGNEMTANQKNLPLIVLKLTAVVGVTWILGFVLAFYPTPYLEYPFVIINSSQGLLICMSFVMRKRVFMLYKQNFIVGPQDVPEAKKDEPHPG